jgi:hypothetical protein
MAFVAAQDIEDECCTKNSNELVDLIKQDVNYIQIPEPICFTTT